MSAQTRSTFRRIDGFRRRTGVRNPRLKNFSQLLCFCAFLWLHSFGEGMKRHILIYGLVGAAVIIVLKLLEYRLLIVERSTDIYGALIGAVFAIFGMWLGLKLTKPKERVIVREIPAAGPFVLNESKLTDLGITRRELQILELIASGLSNREIAEKLFVSENTVKTHSSRLFDKLGAKRRTQAVQIGKEMRLIP